MAWWNPAAENQATDRAHRIGQDKAVFVYKLIVRHSVEEKVQKLHQFKQGLADQLFAGGKGQVWQGNAMVTHSRLLDRTRRWVLAAVGRCFAGQSVLSSHGHFQPRAEDWSTPEGSAGVDVKAGCVFKATSV